MSDIPKIKHDHVTQSPTPVGDPEGLGLGFNWVSILALVAFIILIVAVVIGAMNG